MARPRLLPCGVLLLAAASPFGAPHAQPGSSATATVTVTEPRAFGYVLGDVVQRRVLLHLPSGTTLDPASLPPVRRPGQALELRAARLQGSELLLEYQVFFAPPEVRTLEMPPLRLRFTGPGGETSLRVDAWPLTVAPLVPLDVSPREGLGEMRPDVAPPAIDTGARRLRLALLALALATLGAVLLHLHVGLPWSRRRRGPFAWAWKALRLLPATVSREQHRAALLHIHRALNRSAGRAVFADGLADFVAAQPRFAPVEAALRGFFQRSQDAFFADRATATDTADTAWLRDLARACLAAERGAGANNQPGGQPGAKASRPPSPHTPP